jgi:hypothetical protein
VNSVAGKFPDTPADTNHRVSSLSAIKAGFCWISVPQLPPTGVFRQVAAASLFSNPLYRMLSGKSVDW